MKSVYLDHAATTPMLPAAIQAMAEQFARVGNPSSLHAAGRESRRVVEESRETIAAAVGAGPNEVIFTGGGTESDNLAVKGIYWSRRDADLRRRRIIASAVEHHAVLDCLEWLGKHEDADVTCLPVDALGRIHPAELRAAIEEAPEDVALVSVMWANNEVGTVQPIRELAAVAHEYDIPFHTDAVQAVGVLPVDFTASGVDALTLTGHKLGGPVGAGVLLLGRDVACTPVLHGGGQERDVRSGTLDTPAIAGLAVAVAGAVGDRSARSARLAGLRDGLVRGVVQRVPDAVLNGDPGDQYLDGGPTRLPGNAHLSFPGCEGDALLMLLDARGVECSTGSACSAGVSQPSHVLLAMGASVDRARGSLRFALGHPSTDADVAHLLDVIAPVVDRARRAGMAGTRRESVSVREHTTGADRSEAGGPAR
ncbi:MAG: cysteine desulfurase family protein [Geodermatophilaceae bacterium]|nr:cysteine desulfurase [Geodermatophilaceae bacterium]